MKLHYVADIKCECSELSFKKEDKEGYVDLTYKVKIEEHPDFYPKFLQPFFDPAYPSYDGGYNGRKNTEKCKEV